jgi:hypothetical protein
MNTKENKKPYNIVKFGGTIGVAGSVFPTHVARRYSRYVLKIGRRCYQQRSSIPGTSQAAARDSRCQEALREFVGSDRSIKCSNPRK